MPFPSTSGTPAPAAVSPQQSEDVNRSPRRGNTALAAGVGAALAPIALGAGRGLAQGLSQGSGGWRGRLVVGLRGALEGARKGVAGTANAARALGGDASAAMKHVQPDEIAGSFARRRGMKRVMDSVDLGAPDVMEGALRNVNLRDVPGMARRHPRAMGSALGGTNLQQARQAQSIPFLGRLLQGSGGAGGAGLRDAPDMARAAGKALSGGRAAFSGGDARNIGREYFRRQPLDGATAAARLEATLGSGRNAPLRGRIRERALTALAPTAGGAAGGAYLSERQG